jgi:chromate transporter
MAPQSLESNDAPPREQPTLAAVALYFLRLGATGFGGPVALANYIRRDWVEELHWLSDQEYSEGLAIASATPGPLAYKLAIYCGYVRRGIAGGLAVAVTFGLAPFLLVLATAALYSHFSGSTVLRSLFYGVSPVVVGLIARACLDLGTKTLGRNTLAYVIAAFACALTAVIQRELTALFVGAGILGIFVFARPLSASAPTPPEPNPTPSESSRCVAPVPLAAAFAAVQTGIAWKLFLFFFETGLLVFGSGLVIVPFLQTYVVDEYHWLTQRQFLDAVAVGMISPGPVVISATFVGYMLDSVRGAAAATVGIFLPSVIFIIVGTPLLRRYRANARLQGFVRGVTVAVVGVLVGTVYLVGKTAIGDPLTIVLALGAAFAPLVWRKLPDQVLVLVGAAVGLIAFPLLNPAWVR